ncbi:MAG: hypothetical protein NC453_12255 [Muribaculum sp.]|nr:hypothetical protein [Muribaculum sp.]
MKSKYEQMQEWLTANPGKSKEDWLLACRCISDKQREIMKQVFSSGLEYSILSSLPLKKEYATGIYEPIADCIKPIPFEFESEEERELEEFIYRGSERYYTKEYFDISIDGIVMDMDMPDECFNKSLNSDGQWLNFFRYKFKSPIYATAVYESNRSLTANNSLFRWDSPEFLKQFCKDEK